jgi:hypothetical protein
LGSNYFNEITINKIIKNLKKIIAITLEKGEL